MGSLANNKEPECSISSGSAMFAKTKFIFMDGIYHLEIMAYSPVLLLSSYQTTVTHHYDQLLQPIVEQKKC